MTEETAGLAPHKGGVVMGARTLAPSRRGPLLRGAIAIAAAVALYLPILYYMVLHWSEVEDYSHGFLIVPLAAYFAWERRAALRNAPIAPSWLGIAPLLLGSLALAIGRLGTENMNMRVSFVLTLIGLVLLLLGRSVFRILAFPLLFLFLMIPLPQSLVNVVTFPLKLVAADFAVNILYWLNIPALREGNIIHLATTSLFVADACSGLRSVMALITLGVVFAYFFRKSLLERLVIVLSAIPIAILVNALRVALTGILTHYFGESVARGWIHETQGLFTFVIAFFMLLIEAWTLAKIWPRAWRKGARVGVSP